MGQQNKMTIEIIEKKLARRIERLQELKDLDAPRSILKEEQRLIKKAKGELLFLQLVKNYDNVIIRN